MAAADALSRRFNFGQDVTVQRQRTDDAESTKQTRAEHWPTEEQLRVGHEAALEWAAQLPTETLRVDAVQLRQRRL